MSEISTLDLTISSNQSWQLRDSGVAFVISVGTSPATGNDYAIADVQSTAGAGLVKNMTYTCLWPTMSVPQLNDDNYIVDRPVIKSVTLKMMVTGVVGTPRLNFWLLNAPTPLGFGVNFPDTNDSPGPYDPGYSISSSAVPSDYSPFYSVNPLAGHLRTSRLFTSADVSSDTNDPSTRVEIELDPVPFNMVMRDESGTDPWARALNIVLSVDDGWAGYQKGTVDGPNNYITVTSTSPLAQANDEADFSVEYTDWHTGHQTTDLTRRARTVHDNRLGLPGFSDDMIEDGFSEGVWVHPWDYDPEDPFEEDRPLPKSDGMTDGKPVD